jgi:formylglycine-generating enzyme required for sulfatase activity
MKKAFALFVVSILLVTGLVCAETTVTPLFNGVVRTHNTRTSPRLLNINVITISLHEPGVRFLVSPSNGDTIRGEASLKTPKAFLEEVGAQVAINANFFEWTTYPTGTFANLYGLACSNGKMVSSFSSSWPALNITKENVPAIIRNTTDGYSLFNAIAGSALIVSNGANNAYGLTDSLSTDLHPRTAAGISADGNTLILMTVDGRNAEVSLGVSLVELANLMIEYGAANAINLDGGGSTQMIIDEGAGAYTANVPSETARAVGASLAVFAWPLGATSGPDGYEDPVDPDETIGLEFVRVGDPGNAADAYTPYGYARGNYGAVDHPFYISKYEITCAQYAEFLNAVASNGDPHGLYVSASTNGLGDPPQISKTQQSDGSYVYTPNFGWKNRPIGYITWARAARFCNWLTTGDTETGVYTFSGTTATINKAFRVGHTPAYWIPDANEYYKAAYYDTDAKIYYNYPTSSDTVPTSGNFTGTNSGNWRENNLTVIGEPYNLSKVGMFVNTYSPNGCYDMLGNVWEWTEEFIAGGSGQYGPMYHGGSYYSNTYLYSCVDYYTGYVPSGTTSIPGINETSFDRGMRIACNEEAMNPSTPDHKIKFVEVGDPGNPADAMTAYGYKKDTYGSVGYRYGIGKYEITCAQYAEFLNAVASVNDPYGLYVSTVVGSEPQISRRQNEDGTYVYAANYGWAYRPIGYVTWARAARFCNWLTTGDTENGVYVFVDGVFNSINETLRNGSSPAYWIPRLNEYYKAAYYDPATMSYYDYPTSTNTAPVAGNYWSSNSGNWRASNVLFIGSPYSLTEVGSFVNSKSPYGCYDIFGNSWEWTEEFIAGTSTQYGPMYHGGSYYSNTYLYSNANYFTNYVTTGTAESPGVNVANFDMGMRLACNVAALNKDKLAGDANGDGAVDVGDLGILAANYGKASGAVWSEGDFNSDGAVDVGDLGILAAHYGTNSSSANWSGDYAKVFGLSATDDTVEADQENNGSICSSMGLSLITGLLIAGLMLVKIRA